MSVFGRGWASSLVSHWDTLRGSYWFVPMLMAVLASGLALGLIELDGLWSRAELRRLPWIQDAGPEGTRALLSTVAGSMITVTGVVFSITIVALTLASSQFGPRLLRNFLRDRGNQLVLGTFVATFLYSLLVLRAVEADRVPYLATAVALGLAVTSVFVLIYFVHHAARSIQASSVIASVAAEIDEEIASVFPEALGRGGDAEARCPATPPRFRGDGAPVLSPTSGYVRVVDGDALIGLAVERDRVIEVLARPGDFVCDGDPLARINPAERTGDEAIQRVREGFVIGSHRTAVQDLAFLTDQLAEMAVRALSPGTNDPRTAIACVHRLGDAIGRVSGREMPSSQRYDEEGVLRILARPTTFAGVVASCLDPIRRYGVHDAEVVEAVLVALASACARCSDPDRQEILVEHAREWRDGFGRSASDSKRDRAQVDAAFARVEEVLGELGR